MTTSTALKLVDDLGLLQDKIDELTEQAEDIKAQLKMLGAGTYRGTMYSTVVTLTPERKSTSWASVAKEMNPPAELIAKHTKVTYNNLSATTTPLSN